MLEQLEQLFIPSRRNGSSLPKRKLKIEKKTLLTLKNFIKMFYGICFLSMSNLWPEKSVFSELFLQNKNQITRTKRRVRHFIANKNFSFDQHKSSLVLLPFLPEQLLNRELIEILRRQYCILLTALEEKKAVI